MTATHPAGKCYGFSIEAEKLYFYCSRNPGIGREAIYEIELLDFRMASKYNSIDDTDCYREGLVDYDLST